MNLKEAFRYQSYLDRIMSRACSSIIRPEHCILTKRLHKKSEVNPEDADIEEVVDVDEFIENDIVVSFIENLIEQKEMLSIAIGNAKRGLPQDVDAEIEANKFRRKAVSALKYMLENKPKKSKSNGTGYRFNVEGNQVPYTYAIETTGEELFNRKADKAMARRLATDADKVSETIDAYMVNTEVFYTPPFDVDDDYEDVIADYAENLLRNRI